MKEVRPVIVAGTYRIIIDRVDDSRIAGHFYDEIKGYVEEVGLQLVGLSKSEASDRLAEIAEEAERREWEVDSVDTGGSDWGVWLRGYGVVLGIAEGLELEEL